MAGAVNAQNLKSFIGDNKKWGLKDQTGRVIIPAKYEHAGNLIEGLARVKNKKGKYGFIDSTGKEIIPFKFDDAGDFSEGLADVRIGDNNLGKHGYIDKTGKEIVPLKYDHAESFTEGLAYVALNNKHGFIDKTGKEIIPLKYDNASYFSEGLAPVELNHNYGFIDKTGKEIISLKYDYAWSFDEGLARVKVGGSFNGKYGFIDKTGKEVIPLKYENASDFYNGIAEVKLNGRKFYIDYWAGEVSYNYKVDKIGYHPKVDLTKIETGKDVTAEKPVDNILTEMKVVEKPQKPSAFKETEKEVTVKTIDVYKVIKSPQGGYGIRGGANNNILFPPILDYIDNGDIFQSFTVTLGGYTMERGFFNGNENGAKFQGDMNCDVCQGSGVVNETYHLSGDRTTKRYTSYLGNGITSIVTVTTTEPPKNVQVKGSCKRCSGIGKMKGGIDFGEGKVRVWFWKDELEKSRN